MPAACDLTRCGWTLVDGDDAAPCVCLMDLTISGLTISGLTISGLTLPGRERPRTLVLGVAEPDRRAYLLDLGFGEVMGDFTLEELEARALRLAERVPRYRRYGALELDLVTREAAIGDMVLNLHPREFALLWRLMASPGEVVAKAALLEEVWRLRQAPGTNSLAVHTCRLRRKLAAGGMPDLIATTADGYGFAIGAQRLGAVATRLAVDSFGGCRRLTDDPPLYETVPP